MTSLPRLRAHRPLLILLPALLGFVACAPQDASDYCKNHYEFHEQHLDSLGALSITMAADGLIQSELRLPSSVLEGSNASTLLQDTANVYTLQTNLECEVPAATVSNLGDGVVASYKSQCGADNKIGQVDVSLFESLSTIDELEVTVTTPATQKHFVISRRCESAIFRLN